MTRLPRRPSETYSHGEADSLIALHVILSIEECTNRDVDVWSPGTNVLSCSIGDAVGITDI